MLSAQNVDYVEASCHCGAVTLRLPHPPMRVRHCNCSLCRRYGTLWAYYTLDSIDVSGSESTETYAWGDKNVDFYRCRTCGCVTHWLPRNTNRDTVGVNARLLEPALLEAADVEYRDAAGTGLFH